MEKMDIRDVSLRGKMVFIRCDFNVPLDEFSNIRDDSRIRATVPTINYATDSKAKVILASHLGRPKGKLAPKLSLAPVAKRLERILGHEIIFSKEIIGKEVDERKKNLGEGEILLLENLRFHKGEEENDEEFARNLAKDIDVYINDAFGAIHRPHASIIGIARYVPLSVAGFLLKKEVEYLEKIKTNPVRPFLAILGGAKVSDKIGVIGNLMDNMKRMDKIVIGGGMMFTFLKAQGYEVGRSIIEEDMIELAEQIIEKAFRKGIKFYLPVDCVITDSLEKPSSTRLVPVQEIPPDGIGVDIGPASTRLFREVLTGVNTIFWNGPMGIYEIEEFSKGTYTLAQYVGDSYTTSIVGGGDTLDALHRCSQIINMTFVSTGGGASLKFLEGKGLPGWEVLTQGK